MRVALQASALLNPGEKGEPLATVVRIYQLKAITKLQVTSFDELLEKDKDLLGDDLLAVNEVTLNPGETLIPPFNRNADAVYIAAVALFRQPAGTTWRATARLQAADPDYCRKPGASGAGGAGGAGGSAANANVRFFLDENRIELRQQ